MAYKFDYYRKGKYKEQPTMTLDEYCLFIADWLMLNQRAISIEDFYFDAKNAPFEYRLEDVIAEDHPAIYAVLSERILKFGLKNKLNSTLAKSYLAKRFGSKCEIDLTNSDEITFRFGE